MFMHVYDLLHCELADKNIWSNLLLGNHGYWWERGNGKCEGVLSYPEETMETLGRVRKSNCQETTYLES